MFPEENRRLEGGIWVEDGIVGTCDERLGKLEFILVVSSIDIFPAVFRMSRYVHGRFLSLKTSVMDYYTI